MIIRVTMKDGQIHRYDGVISISHHYRNESSLWNGKLFIVYYAPSSAKDIAELNLTEVKSFHYGE